MPEPAGQPSFEAMLRQTIQHPQLAEDPAAPPSPPTDPNDALRRGANNDQYVQSWAQTFGQIPGQPGEPPPPGVPPAPPAEVTQGAQPQPQPLRDPQGRFTKVYAGKYRSPEDLEQGYLNQFQETQRMKAENDALKAANLLVQQTQFRTRQERPEPIPVSVREDGSASIAPDSFDSIIEERARQVAQEQISAILGPVLKGNEALQAVRQSYSDFSQNEAEFNKWLLVNPEVSKRASSTPELGVEWAYLRFKNERGALLNEQTQQAAAQSAPQVNQARQHAAPSPSARVVENEDSTRAQRLQQLYEYGQRTGDWNPYKRFRLGEVVPQWHAGTQWGV